jgi:hypothetical protein
VASSVPPATEARQEAPSGPFARELDDPDVAVAVDAASGSSCVLVCFGGLSGGLSGPPFEFLRLTGGLTVTRVFVRDLHQSWYQRGIAGLGPDLPSSARALSTMLDDLGGRRRVFAGTSAGGFAAMLYGSLIGADRVVAFSPQTTLLRVQRLALRDRRWRLQVESACHAAVSRSHLDLRAARRAGFRPEATIYYGTGDRRDTAHALRLRGCEGVTLAPRAGGHVMVRTMRENGELLQTLAGALSGDRA